MVNLGWLMREITIVLNERDLKDFSFMFSFYVYKENEAQED